jgi:hypothetical protein
MKSLIIRVVLFFGWLLNKSVSFIGRQWPLGAILIKDSLSQADTFKNIRHISTSKRVIEHLILSGATQVLKNPKLKSVLVEVDDHFDKLSAQVSEILISSGFSFKEKQHSAMFDGGDFSHSYNQIWIRRNE